MVAVSSTVDDCFAVKHKKRSDQVCGDWSGLAPINSLGELRGKPVVFSRDLGVGTLAFRTAEDIRREHSGEIRNQFW